MGELLHLLSRFNSAVLIGFSSNQCDAKMVTKGLNQSRHNVPRHWTLLDAMGFLRNHFGNPAKYNLGELYRLSTGKELINAHGADTYARALKTILQKVFDAVPAENKQSELLNKLQQYQQKPKKGKKPE